jgi:hypothetical protein
MGTIYGRNCNGLAPAGAIKCPHCHAQLSARDDAHPRGVMLGLLVGFPFILMLSLCLVALYLLR